MPGYAAHKTSATRSRKWCFTLNNPVGGKEIYDDWVCEYLIVGLEAAPTTRTAHHQGYVRFANPRMLTGVKKLLPTAHWEPCAGTERDNFDYCTKDENIVIEWGVPEAPADETADESKTPGRRNDLDHTRQMVLRGATMRDICEHARSYQALRGAEILYKYLEPGRTWKTHVTWIYGPTGTGKTTLARALCQTEPWVSGKTLQWFQGYDGHEDAIFDEFRGDYCTLHELLRLFDALEFRIEHKGGSRQWLARRVFVTSCFPPEVAYKTTGEDLRQLGRRIEQIVWIPEQGKALCMPGSAMGNQPMAPYVWPIAAAPREPSRAPPIGAASGHRHDSVPLPSCAHAQEVGGNTSQPLRSPMSTSSADDPPTRALSRLDNIELGEDPLDEFFSED